MLQLAFELFHAVEETSSTFLHIPLAQIGFPPFTVPQGPPFESSPTSPNSRGGTCPPVFGSNFHTKVTLVNIAGSVFSAHVVSLFSTCLPIPRTLPTAGEEQETRPEEETRIKAASRAEARRRDARCTHGFIVRGGSRGFTPWDSMGSYPGVRTQGFASSGGFTGSNTRFGFAGSSYPGVDP